MKPMFLTALICSLAIQDGFSQSSTTSLRELILARRLFRCGDHNGLGRKRSRLTATTSAVITPPTPGPYSAKGSNVLLSGFLAGLPHRGARSRERERKSLLFPGHPRCCVLRSLQEVIHTPRRPDQHSNFPGPVSLTDS